MRCLIATGSPYPPAIVMDSELIITRFACPNCSSEACSILLVNSPTKASPPVIKAKSFKRFSRLSPNPGGLTTATLKMPLLWFSSKPDKALSVTSSAIISKGRFSTLTSSSIGTRSIRSLISLSHNKIYGFSKIASSRTVSVTKVGDK